MEEAGHDGYNQRIESWFRKENWSKQFGEVRCLKHEKKWNSEWHWFAFHDLDMPVTPWGLAELAERVQRQRARLS